MSIHKSIIIIAVLGSCLWIGCQKDSPTPSGNTSVSVSSNGSVYITNEGNFGAGNAMVSYFNPSTGVSSEDLYKPANGNNLGDVCQSMTVVNEKAYLVVNNSGKVVVVNPLTFQLKGTIGGLNSPRYFLPITNSKAYVSDLYANGISVVDLNANSKIGFIACPGWTEQMIYLYGKVFVTNETHNQLYVVDPMLDKVTDSIAIGYGANSIKQDKNGKIWVLCGGSTTLQKAGGIYRINPSNNQVELAITCGNLSDSPWRLALNPTNDTLYYLNGGVYRLSINDLNFPSSAFLPKLSHSYYGLGINPADGSIYVSDAIDYVQRGTVYRISPTGKILNQFLAGIIPGDFYFN